MFDELADGVFRRRYESLDLNVGVVIGEDGVLVIDTRSFEREGLELRDELAQLTAKPVKWVVNTHSHWDHAYGNSVFDDAEIWGHELCKVALETRGEVMKDDAKCWLPETYHEEIDRVRVVRRIEHSPIGPRSPSGDPLSSPTTAWATPTTTS